MTGKKSSRRNAPVRKDRTERMQTVSYPSGGTFPTNLHSKGKYGKVGRKTFGKKKAK